MTATYRCDSSQSGIADEKEGTQKMPISKSKYTLGVKCPKTLWLSKHKPKTYDRASMNQQILDTGNLVGDLAMSYYGDFTEIEFDPKGFPKMIAQTRELIESGTPIICEATFSKSNMFAMVDILRNLGNGDVMLTEVKSGTHGINDPKKPQKQYLEDIAFQCALLTECGYNVRKACLLYVNTSYVLDGELDVHEYFTEEDVTEQALAMHDEVMDNMKRFAQVMKSDEEPDVSIGCQCKKPYDCPYMKYCWRDVPEHDSVFDLQRIRSDKAHRLYKSGIRTYADALANPKEAKLNDKQLTQALMFVNESAPLIDVDEVSDFLDSLSYPLCFFDFETCKPAIPQYQGTRPYQQLPTQYSVHSVVSKGAPLTHTEFLAKEGEDPRRSVAEALVGDIPADATVLAWHASFERLRLTELADTFPDLRAALENIRDNIVDLETPFVKMWYYDWKMNGSSSIKKVLPALFPDDESLSYDEQAIGNGEDAAASFLSLADGTHSPEESAEIREALLRYCELDTLAEVRIWEKLVEVVENADVACNGVQKAA